MAHFAEINNDNKVLRVLVLDDAHESGGSEYLKYDLNFGGTWIQTSYNGTIRKNFAGIGDTYDPIRDAFIAPKPFASWVLNEDTCQWEAPIAFPTDGNCHSWNEALIQWDLV